VTYNPNASHNLTYPNSGKAPTDTRWFDVRKVGPDYNVKKLEGLIEYYTQMAERCRSGKSSSFAKLTPEQADGFERAANEVRAELAERKGEAA
jgi:hypothetical protein